MLKCLIVLNFIDPFLSLIGDSSKIELLRVCKKFDFFYFLSLSPTKNFHCRDEEMHLNKKRDDKVLGEDFKKCETHFA